MVGKRLGPYQVLAKLGEGGMGEVYRARDTRLDRVVAIKVLPAATAADPEFRARFEREARAISQLNHPHICTLFDVGEENGVSFLVMEHIEGDTLADRLAKGALPIDRALEYAVEIADALDKAHRRGITHRDLKPGNVMLTKAGTKLLDFGLAKIGLIQTPGSTETRLAPALATGADAAPLTSRGSLLGTFQYMAPEQLEGLEVDARADIWAFGCVLYETVTGNRAFEGKTQASLIAAILEREPAPLDTLHRDVPPALSRLVRTCLAKDPDDRFQTAHDLRLQLEWIQEGSAAALSAPVVAHGIRRNTLMWTIVTVAVAGLTGIAVWRLKPSPIDRHVVGRFEYVLPEGQHFTRPNSHDIALSPDGTKLVYVANNQLYLRWMNQLDAQPIPGTTNVDPLEPVFSPDSQSVAFFAPKRGRAGVMLFKVALAGGQPQQLCDIPGLPWGVSWRNGLIAFGQNTRGRSQAETVSGIQIVPDSGGTPRTVASVDGDKEPAGHPQLLDDGRHVLFVVIPNGATEDEGQFVVQSLDGGQRRALLTRGTDPRVLPTGHLVYVHDSTLNARTFDPETLIVGEGSVQVADGITQSLGAGSTGQFAISSSGVLALLSGLGRSTLVWVGRQGQETNIPSATPRAYGRPRLSPNGTRIAFTSLDQGKRHIWVLDLAREAPAPIPVTSGATVENNLVWQDDNQIIYSSGVPPASRALFRKTFDAPTPEPLTKTAVGSVTSVSPDKKYVVYQTSEGVDASDLMLLSLEGGGTPRPLFVDPNYGERNGEISPDGQWIAYESWETGRPEVYVRPFPDVERRRFPKVSTDGGAKPVWARSGQELFYIQYEAGRDYSLMRVAVQRTDATLTFGAPTQLFPVLPYDSGTTREFDVSLKGDRFLMVKQAGDSSLRPSIVIVTNRFDELRARVPTGR